MRMVLLMFVFFGALPAAAAEVPPAKVLLLGTYHFANPGQDQYNVEAIDVLTESAQAQMEAIVDALARFRPTQVFVEWPAEITDERYAQYQDDRLPPSRNEVVQLGFRLAQRLRLARVHGIDVSGRFPYDAIVQWAQANGRAEQLQAGHQFIGEHIQQVERLQSERGIAAALRLVNDEQVLRRGHGIYLDLLRYGSGDQQPGAELNAAWFERNIRTCALLLQQLDSGGRAFVLFGSGHVPWLQRCIEDAPGVELVPVDGYLPADGD